MSTSSLVHTLGVLLPHWSISLEPAIYSSTPVARTSFKALKAFTLVQSVPTTTFSVLWMQTSRRSWTLNEVQHGGTERRRARGAPHTGGGRNVTAQSASGNALLAKFSMTGILLGMFSFFSENCKIEDSGLQRQHGCPQVAFRASFDVCRYADTQKKRWLAVQRTQVPEEDRDDTFNRKEQNSLIVPSEIMR